MNHVLIVNDQEASRFLLKTQLEDSGYRVTQAANGIEALVAARRERPDIIVSEALLPRMDGFMLCRAWMQDAALKTIPFVFYSATYTDPQDEKLALALGAVRYLIKPVETDVFLRELSTVLQEWTLRTVPAPAVVLEDGAFYALHDAALARKLERKVAQLELERAALQESERRYSELVARIPVGVFSFRITREGSQGFDYVSSRFCAMNAIDADTPLADMNMVFERVHPDDLPRLTQALEPLASCVSPFAWEGRLVIGTTLRWARIESSPIVQDNGDTVWDGVQLDITERKLREDTLREAATVLASTHDGVLVTDLNVHILSVNPAFTAITGYTEAEVLGRNPRLLRSGRQPLVFYQSLWANVLESGHWQGEIWNRRKNGEIYPQWLTISTVRDKEGKPSRYVAVFSDISQIKQSEEKLEHLAHYDALTQLPNRRLLFFRLEHSIEQAQREKKMLALLMLDLDHFKDVNDSFGHLAGDELLQLVAQRLNARLRDVDTICRLGGDEFTVLLEKITQPEDAARIANEIIKALSEPWHLSNGAEVRIGVSVGISLFPTHGKLAQELLQQADTALYQAKAEGRGRFKYFSEDLTRSVRARIGLEVRLRRALEQNELRVFYQPQMDIASGRIVGAEALVRWEDPVEGLIQPARFIYLAEETGLMTSIGNWVLQETCRQGQRWLVAGLAPLRLAVNLSAHQFLHSNILEVVVAALAESGFPAAHLELELTESVLMEREAQAIEILDQLHALGVQLAIDNFGTGYSSLAYLKRFPLDSLKIGKRFVANLSHDWDDQAVAATIIAMAHTLHLKALAAGVETQEQLDVLRDQGSDVYQGYLMSEPLSAEKFEQLLVARGQT